jgi:membrane fusion protein, multidrug efflux system
MKSRWLICLLIAVLPWSCGKKSNGELATPLPTVPVKTALAEVGAIEVEREFGGGLEGIKQADLFIRLSEAVVSLPFRIGAQVHAGDVVILLDRGGASSQYFQAKSTYENAEKTYNKMKYLFEEKAISETQFDEAKSVYEVTRANFQAAKELVEITSPINGTLVELDVVVGDIPQMGKIAARIARTDTLRMTFGVPSTLAGMFTVGMAGELRVSLDDSVYSCRVSRVASAAEPQTRTFTIEIAVPNPDRRLQPGAFAKAKFVVERVEGALKVPQAALLSQEGVHRLFVVKSDTAYAHTVDLGLRNEHYVQILSGVSAGDEVVYLGQGFLSNGYPITRSEK